MMTQSEQETVLRLMRNAVDAWPQLDDPDPKIDGADLLQWFALWRSGVKATLEVIDRHDWSPHTLHTLQLS